VDAGGTLADWPDDLPAELEPLTAKPLLAVENGPNGIDLKFEAELAELGEEAAAFRESESALEEVVRRLSDELGLISFFTASDKETRAWILRRGQSALDAAATVHSDLARGFIRAEVNGYDELVAVNGAFAELRARGQLRLEGKDYIVRDGEICHFRFNVAR
jgi:ribosome-binding ATPase YchF (GTP1/OBG family)